MLPTAQPISTVVVMFVHSHAARTGSIKQRCILFADRSRAAADDWAACAAERALLAGVLWPLDTMVKRRCIQDLCTETTHHDISPFTKDIQGSSASNSSSSNCANDVA